MDQRNISGDYDVLLDLVKSRASVRKLKPDPIPDEYVTQILEVGRWAMSGANGQPWERMFVRRGVLAALLAAIALWPGGPALALEKVRLGKAVPNSFAFGATEVGIEAKIFEAEGIEIEVTSFRGDAQLQQALAAGGVDVGLGSGPGLADLKGKRIGVTSAGSLTDWLVRELSRQQGWGSDGIQIVALGQMQARLAAIQRGELDGMVIEAATGYELEEAGKAKNFMLFGDIAKDFYTHVIFATDDLIEKRPDLLRRFLRGWFKTIAFMRANKDFAVASEAKTIAGEMPWAPGFASAPEPITPGGYQFFSPNEVAFIDAAISRLIPAGALWVW